MNIILAIAVLATALLAAVGLTVLALVTAAIHAEEHHLSLPSQPTTLLCAAARTILAAKVSEAAGRRISRRARCNEPSHDLERFEQ